MKDIREEFPRTTCDCARCTVGCRSMPGQLIPGDIQNIGRYVGINHHHQDEVLDFLQSKFCASSGTRALNAQGKIVIIPTIVPQQKENGECVFLKDGKCSIHPVSPFGCSRFDSHMDYKTAATRVLMMVQSSANNPMYQLMALLLSKLGHEARPIRERKEHFNKLFEELDNGESSAGNQCADGSGSDASHGETAVGRYTETTADP